MVSVRQNSVGLSTVRITMSGSDATRVSYGHAVCRARYRPMYVCCFTHAVCSPLCAWQ